MGIDTVELQGNGYNILVEENERVTKNTLLAEIDLSLLKENNKDTSIMVVFPEMKDPHLTIQYGMQMNGNEIGSIV